MCHLCLGIIYKEKIMLREKKGTKKTKLLHKNLENKIRSCEIRSRQYRCLKNETYTSLNKTHLFCDILTTSSLDFFPKFTF